MIDTWNLLCRARRWIYFGPPRRFFIWCPWLKILGGAGAALPLVPAHPRSRVWGNVSEIASVAQNIFTCKPYMPNFKSLASPVWAVGGGGLKMRYIIFNYVTTCNLWESFGKFEFWQCSLKKLLKIVIFQREYMKICFRNNQLSWE